MSRCFYGESCPPARYGICISWRTQAYPAGLNSHTRTLAACGTHRRQMSEEAAAHVDLPGRVGVLEMSEFSFATEVLRAAV